MASSLNPFYEDETEDYTNYAPLSHTESVSLNSESSDVQSSQNVHTNRSISWDSIAAKLLSESYHLTALELHTELIESGHELHRLRDFFSNPSNFERSKPEPSSNLYRTPSCQTFDSFDSRYSDDGEQTENDKVAVLEYELRAANETINSLRQALTRYTEDSTKGKTFTNEDPPSYQDYVEVKVPDVLERRVLNFLCQEYLNLIGCRLTAVTFTEEIVDQDFEDWDDVGLNVARPAGLLQLYRTHNERRKTGEINQDTLKEIKELKLDLREMQERVELLTKENENLTSDLSQSVKKNQVLFENYEKFRKRSKTLTESDNNSTLISHPSVSISDDSCFQEPLKSGKEIQAGGDCEGAAEHDTNSQSTNQKSANLKDISREEIFIHDWQPCTRLVAKGYQQEVMKSLKDVKVAIDDKINDQINCILNCELKNIDNIVNILSNTVSQILPNVLIAKRQELLPLILCIAILHGDSQTRDQQLRLIFNLIKRPSPEQRAAILATCISFAKQVGPLRTEMELLPQCWEQIADKHVEKRILVAEACGRLVPYIPNEITSSLLLSMLHQMLAEDKDDEVKKAAIKSLSTLAVFIQDSEKFILMKDLLLLALSDHTKESQTLSTTKQCLLPCMAMWASELHQLDQVLVGHFLLLLENQIEISISCEKPLNLDCCSFHGTLETLRLLLPIHLAYVISNPQHYSSPVDDEVISVMNSAAISSTTTCTSVGAPSPAPSPAFSSAPSATTTTMDGSGIPHSFDMSKFPQPMNCLYDIDVICDRQAQLRLDDFTTYISREWYEPWESFNWIAGEMVPRLIVLVNKLSASNQPVVHSLCVYFRAFCLTMGRVFSITKIKSRFSRILHFSSENTENDNEILEKCIVPVYAIVLSTINEISMDNGALLKYLNMLILKFANKKKLFHGISSSFKELSLLAINHATVVHCLRDMYEDVDHQIRLMVMKLVNAIICQFDANYYEGELLQMILKLSCDKHIEIQIQSIPSLGALLELSTNHNVLSDVMAQFSNLVDLSLIQCQRNRSSSMLLCLIQVFARIAPNIDPVYRTDFILPKITMISEKIVASYQDGSEISLALFEAYSSLSCCFMEPIKAQPMMLSGLKCVHSHFSKMGNEYSHHIQVLTSMMKQLENTPIIQPNISTDSSFVSDLSRTASIAYPDMKTRMRNSFKEAREKASTSNFSKFFG